MTAIAPASTATNARSSLLPYTLALIGATTIIQIVIATTGGQVSLLAAILTAIVAVGIALWFLFNQKSLKQIRFGPVIAHSIAYVTVTASFNAHAAIRTISLGAGENGMQSIVNYYFASQWFGVTLIMSSVWGIGLLIHLVGSVLGRGWED